MWRRCGEIRFQLGRVTTVLTVAFLSLSLSLYHDSMPKISTQFRVEKCIGLSLSNTVTCVPTPRYVPSRMQHARGAMNRGVLRNISTYRAPSGTFGENIRCMFVSRFRYVRANSPLKSGCRIEPRIACERAISRARSPVSKFYPSFRRENFLTSVYGLSNNSLCNRAVDR